jgi:cobalt-zinc-cadmium efflux system outer membrane protein
MKRMATLALCWTLGGCVPADAGYQDARSVVRQRTSSDVRWEHIDGRSEAERRTRELLAKPLDAQAAVQVALLNNPELQAAFEEIGIARANLVHALRLPNPSLEGAMHFHGGENPDLDLHAMIGLSDFFFIAPRHNAARAELDASALSVGGAAMDLALGVKKAFYAYVSSAQILDLRRTMLLAAKASEEVANELHEAGNVTDLDLASERALYEEARLGVAQSESNLVEHRQELLSLLGLGGRGVKLVTKQRLPDPPKTELDVANAETRAISRSIDLAIATKRYAAAGKRANLARAEGLVPELKAGVSAERDEGDWGFGPAAAVEVPLFYQGQGEVARARAEMRREERTHTALALRIRTATRAVATRLSVTRERVRFYRTTLLPLRQKIVDETQRQYNAMNAGVFQLVQAKRDQVETGRAYLEALRDYWIARAEMEQLLAGRLVRSASSDVVEPAPERRVGAEH